jgi:hypothetical protein
MLEMCVSQVAKEAITGVQTAGAGRSILVVYFVLF